MTLIPVQDNDTTNYTPIVPLTLAVNDYTVPNMAVLVGGREYTRFKSYSISRSVDDICGSFSLVLTTPLNNPFELDSVIDIFIDSKQVMRGKVYSVEKTTDNNINDLMIYGRDITGDLIDSTVPDSCKTFLAVNDGVTTLSIFDIAVSMIEAAGMSKLISCINKAGVIEPFSSDEIIVYRFGDTISDHLTRYCRKRQLFLNTDEMGNLVFFRATGSDNKNCLYAQYNGKNNNVISRSTKNSIHDRFYKYICRSQDAGNWGTILSALGLGEDDEDRDIDANGEAFDRSPDIKNTFRVLEFKLEKGGNDADCTGRAIEEAGLRRARAFRYSATVRGYSDIAPWSVDQIVKIVDDFAGIYGFLYLAAVEYRYDLDGGKTTRLELSYLDAYSLIAAQQSSVEEAKQNRASNTGRW